MLQNVQITGQSNIGSFCFHGDFKSVHSYLMLNRFIKIQIIRKQGLVAFFYNFVCKPICPSLNSSPYLKSDGD